MSKLIEDNRGTLKVKLEDHKPSPNTPPKKHYSETLPAVFVISTLSATNAELICYPLDLIKTRLQVQGEPGAFGKVPHRGMTATALGIIKEEGPLKLWKGMSPALYRHVIYSGGRLAFYEQFRQKIGHPLKVWEAAICGAIAGGAAQWLATPTELVKVQMQMEGKRLLMGMEPRYRSVGDAFRQIYNKGGIRGLWAGASPGVIRAACVNVGDLSTYDVSKRFIQEKTGLHPKSALLHFMASTIAGFVGAVVTTPADVIKSRVMNQPIDENGRGTLYKGPLDCLSQTLKNEGMTALYKGFLPLWIRLAPWALVFWMSFEQIRKFSGGPAY